MICKHGVALDMGPCFTCDAPAPKTPTTMTPALLTEAELDALEKFEHEGVRNWRLRSDVIAKLIRAARLLSKAEAVCEAARREVAGGFVGPALLQAIAAYDAERNK